MSFIQMSRIAYVHPADESEIDESVLANSKRATICEVSADDFLSLKRWLQDEEHVDCLLVPGKGWTRLNTLMRQMALPEEFAVHVRLSMFGKRRTRVTALDTPTGKPSTKSIKAIEEYKPYYVEPDKILGTESSFLLADLRWLYLLVEEGKKVSMDALRKLRSEGIKPKEPVYYPGVLALLKSASFGQQGLRYTGQGYGNVLKSDLQGLAACEVKVDLKNATDKDSHGVEANALAIKQTADYLVEGIDRSPLACLFSRMDRFFLVKFQRESHSVSLTPAFPPAQQPNESPGSQYSFHEEFIIMRLAWLDRCTKDKVTLSDVLPAEPTAGFRSLVAYVEELQRTFNLVPSAVRFVTQQGQDISVTEMTRLACGPKSLVLLRRSSNTVVKVCLPEHAANEIQVHNAVDGHENVRKLVSHGRVDVGSTEGVFHFLELEGYGEPFSAKHLATREAAESMWMQAMSALDHLHSNGVLHRDVKPDNMLVFDGVLKLNDFDVSCFKGDGRDENEVAGTEGFQSPSDMSPYAEEDDILSLGLTFYNVQTGVSLSGKSARLCILQRQLHPDRFPQCMLRSVSSALQSLSLDLVRK